MKCSVIAGGEISDYSIFELENSFIICADAGLNHAERLGVRPDVIIGDFDTFSGHLPSDIEVITYPAEKDDTDSMLAIKLGLARGYTEFDIYGALGGRIDHTLGNIQSLMYILSHGGIGRIVGEREIITLIPAGDYTFPAMDGYYFSLLSYSDRCEGIDLQGTKYALQNASIDSAFPIGVSNKITNRYCRLSFKSGYMLVVYAK